MTVRPRRSVWKRLARWLLSRPGPAALLLRVVELLLGGPGPLRGLGRRIEIAITKRLRLFDRGFYLGQLPPGQGTGGPPLRHYVLQGDAAGHHPAPLFDPAHYRRQVGSGTRVNALLHYGLRGRFLHVSPSPWFDLGYYLRSNADVAAAAIDPLQHFVRHGWREGRNPMPGLDLRVMLRDRPGLRVARTNPLVQMLHELRGDATAPPPPTRTAADAAGDDALLEPARWEGLVPRAGGGEPVVDIVVPVYGGRGETLRCLRSVLAAPVKAAYELVVIDDASPDRPLSEALRQLAARGLFTLHRHEGNRGFVRSVNHGLGLHPQRDVVILNADTEVHNDWLDRLLAIGASDPRIASVTPMSNNATICSYPETLHDNWLPLELDDAELDRLAAEVNGLRWVDAPTGVGFCMWMRRACLQGIGAFDEKRFGRGYGEENDWCQRAIERGWVNAVTGGIFVRHHGSVSFAGEANERRARAMRTLQALHPGYDAAVQRHIASDPLWSQRARLDLARLARQRQARNTLLVSHDRGGGTERHLLERAAALRASGVGVFELRPSKVRGAVALTQPELYGLHSVGAIPVADRAMLAEALDRLGLSSIELHHVIDFPPALPEVLMAARDRLGIELVTTVHDYHAICPRINLAGPDGRYCGEPATDACNTCLARDGLKAASGDIVTWRTRQLGLLQRADRVIVPDADVRDRLLRYVPELAIEVCPHDESEVAALPPPPRRADGRTRVLVLGAISRVKGYEVLRRLAETARRLQMPVDFDLLGFSAEDGPLLDAGVHVHGRYDDAQAEARIAEIAPDLVLLPSTWPETYCYTLSTALRTGRPVVVFDLGAQARRVRAGAPAGSRVLPLALADRPEALLQELMAANLHAATPERLVA